MAIGAYAFPELAGIKFRGANLAPRSSDVQWQADNLHSGFYKFHYDIATNDVSDPWNTFLKPQIDAMHAIGVNVVRLGFATELRVGTVTTLTAGQFQAEIALIAEYLASLGMYFYPYPVTSQDANYNHANYGLTQGNIEGYLAEAIGYFDAHPNVIGYDVMQEIDQGGATWAAGLMSAWLTAAHNVTDKPCTLSITTNTAVNLDWSRVSGILSAGADFIDWHIYYQFDPTDFQDDILFNGGDGPSGLDDVPVWVGESGIQNDGEYVGNPPSTPTLHYAALTEIANMARLQGTLAWAALSFPTVAYGPNDWGVYALTQNGSYVFTTPRVPQTTDMQTWPKLIQAYDADQDTGPAMPTPPVVTRLTSTSVSVSWTAATGGDGAITYVPQFAPIDANGFATAAWSSGTPTLSTSVTLTGLPAGQPCAIRIQAEDEAT